MEEKNKGLQRRKYDAGFKAEVLKMVANGQSVAYVSQALGISENLIYRWKQKRKGENKEGQQTDLSLLSAENQQLKERVRQLETEREILKKPWPFSAGKLSGSL
jgi:transposase